MTNKVDERIHCLEESKEKLRQLNKPWDGKLMQSLLSIGKIFSSHLKTAYNTYHLNKDLIRNSEKEIENLRTWKQLDIDVDAGDHLGDVNKLINTRLIWWILGFKNLSERNSTEHPIVVDREKGMMVLKEGELTPVSDLDLKWDKHRNSFVDSSGNGWLYISPGGLTQIDRHTWNEEELRPIHVLDSEELKSVRAEAAKFGREGQCVLQLHASPRPFAPFAQKYAPMHIGMRMINENGEVYTLNMEMDPEDIKKELGSLSTFLKTRDGTVTMVDYEEFRDFEKGRVVTNIPITGEEMQMLMQELKRHHKEGLRFNFLKQNCAKLAVNLLRKLGIFVPIQVSGAKILSKSLGVRIGDFAANCMCLILGLGKARETKHIGAVSNYSETEMNHFDTAYRGIGDLFKAKTHEAFNAGSVIEWQLKQASTQVHEYSKSRPKLALLPVEKENREIREKLEQVFVEN